MSLYYSIDSGVKAIVKVTVNDHFTFGTEIRFKEVLPIITKRMDLKSNDNLPVHDWNSYPESGSAKNDLVARKVIRFLRVNNYFPA